MKAKRIYWTVCAGVSAVGTLIVATTPWLDYTFNLASSLPDTLYAIHKGGEVKKSELIAYHWHGGVTYLTGTTFIKRVAGAAGDTVKRAGSAFWVNDQYVGTAKPFSKVDVSLQPVQEGVIGAGEHFVSTLNPNSLNSRYALTDNVKQAEVIGRAYEIF